MKEKIKIDIVSDVVCPWCTIGFKRLEKAINEMGIQDQIEIEWQPFELNPQMPPEGQNIQEHIAEKYSSTIEQQKKSQRNMAEAGAELGFIFDYFEGMKIVNTLHAHILLEYAKSYGKQTQLKMKLTTLYFSERKDISDLKILRQALVEVGLNPQEGMAYLSKEEAHYEVKSKEDYWQSMGINSVPTIIFNRKSALTGAQPVEVFKEVLTELLPT